MNTEFLSTCRDSKSGRFAALQFIANIMEVFKISLYKAPENAFRNGCLRDVPNRFITVVFGGRCRRNTRFLLEQDRGVVR